MLGEREPSLKEFLAFPAVIHFGEKPIKPGVGRKNRFAIFL
jgi:hypothetical protein